MTQPQPPRPRTPRCQHSRRSGRRPDQVHPGPAPGGAVDRPNRSIDHDSDPDSYTGSAQADEEFPVLVAYVHLHSRTTIDTGGRLTNAARKYAERHGYQLGRVLVAVEGRDDAFALRSLLDEVDAGTQAVLVVGPAEDTFEELERRSDVRVLTLAGARPADPWPDQPWPNEP